MHYKKGNDFDMILENTTKTIYNAPKRPKLRKRQLEQIRKKNNHITCLHNKHLR